VSALFAVLLMGFLIGAAGRWAVPGPDPMPFWLTVLFGYLGSLAGSGIAAALFGVKRIAETPNHVFVTLIFAIGIAAALVIAYRRLIQKRPVSGPEAYRLPTRGIGIGRLRSRLQRLGIDPDAVRTRGSGRPSSGQPSSADENARELERLRGLHDCGELSDEEYEKARKKLRRY
jgi:uncharacterized membrane protein YeaQ/YmgE (transglycosylase-associated protein family)